MLNITVIADTSCLIALSKIEAIELLKELYEEVFITEEIAFEFGEKLPEWIKIDNVKNKKYQQLLDL
jgi:predicted nucleic acid-binding protein